MVNISRDNIVWLCKTPLELDNENQLTFPSRQAQINYFQSSGVLFRAFSDVTFIRKPVDGEVQNFINLEIPINQAYNCNYIMYQNTGDPTRYFFAFVTRLEYVSETTTRFHLQSDAFQSWQFDLTYNQSFIERQTPLDYNDKNTLADSVAVGQLVERLTQNVHFTGGYFAFCSTDITQDDPTESIPYALKVGDYNIPCWTLFWELTEVEKMGKVLGHIANNGYSDRIMSVVYVPFIVDTSLIKLQPFTEYGGFNLATECPTTNLKKDVILDTSSFVGYGKEFTFPYAKVIVEDFSTGQTIELAPEKFEDGVIKFEVQGTISETPTYRVIPKGYEGQYLAYNHALVTKCSTTLPIVNNLYAKYLMENKDINSMNKINSFSSLVSGAMTGTPTGMILGGASTLQSIASITMQENQASKLGNSVTAISDGALERVVFQNGFKISLYRMDEYHRERARNFWKMYGYPVGSLATPNINTNANYNYIKMVNPNIDGKIVPQDELQQIKAMFEKGVTLWHNYGTMGVY